MRFGSCSLLADAARHAMGGKGLIGEPFLGVWRYSPQTAAGRHAHGAQCLPMTVYAGAVATVAASGWSTLCR